MDHIKEGSIHAADVRGLLKTKFPDKENEVKIRFTRLMLESDNDTRAFIMNERARDWF
jgi:hypothetical protein